MIISQALPLGYTLVCTTTGWRASFDSSVIIEATEYKLAKDAILSHYRNSLTVMVDTTVAEE